MRVRALTICAALAVAGCGGEAEQEAAAPSSEKTMPAAEWAAQVEEICDKGADKAEREAVELMQQAQQEGLSEEEAVAKVLEHGADETTPWLDEIAALPAPEGKERQAKDFDQKMRDLLPEMRAMAEIVRERSDQAELERTSQQILKEVLPVRSLARELNIHACIPRNSQA
jgi:hypothetical protein